MTVRLNVTMPDDIAARLRAAAADRPSDYITKAVRRQLLADELRALPPTPDDWAADAEYYGDQALSGKPAK